MKHIAAALIALMTLGISAFASADQPSSGNSILVHEFVLAPVLDATQPPVPIDPPIISAVADSPMPHDDRANKKPPSAIDKHKPVERKRSSWFKRTFLGK